MLKPQSGTIRLEGRPVHFSSNREAIAARGSAYLSEDRLSLGLIQPQSIADNLVISSLDRITSGGLLSDDSKHDLVARWVADLGVKIGLQGDAISTLSGGNQQRIAIAKWLATDPKLLILDCADRWRRCRRAGRHFRHRREIGRQRARDRPDLRRSAGGLFQRRPGAATWPRAGLPTGSRPSACTLHAIEAAVYA